jgi:glycosyltransferase involved in cell wall biosynthesis
MPCEVIIHVNENDNTKHLIYNYVNINKLDIIKIIHSNKDGISNNRNSCLEHISGEYFYFFDYDDNVYIDNLKYLFE